MTHHRLWLARRCVHAGADLGHIEALLSSSWPLSEHQVQEGKTRSGPPAWRERRDRQGGTKRSHTETLRVEAQLISCAQASSLEQVEKQNLDVPSFITCTPSGDTVGSSGAHKP